MTHVTVVQVHEPHLRQVQRDGKASVVVSPGSLGVFQVTKEDRRMFCQEGSFATKECLAEILYVNVMELRQQSVHEEGTSETRSPPSEPPPSNEEALQFPPKLKNRNRRLSRKSSIMNQNVGVTGGVYMKSDPESEIRILEDSDNESESSLSASESSLSGSDSGLSSTIEIGMSPTPKHSTTITIGDEMPSPPKSPGEKTSCLQTAVGEETLWCQKDVGEETHWRQAAVGEETYWCQKGEETHWRQAAVGEETLWRQAAVGKETLWHQAAVGEETHWLQKAIGEETHWRQKAVGEETHWRQKAVGKETHWRQKAVGEEAHLRQKTVGEETLWRPKAVGEETRRCPKAFENEASLCQKGILLHVSPKSSSGSFSDDEEHLTNSHPHDEVISIEYSNFEVSEDLSEAAVTLEWRVIPPSHPLIELERDRGSTPTSFSSAYTVTEHENESTSEESEISRNNWSGPESDEEPLIGVARTEEKQSSLSVNHNEVEVQDGKKPGTYGRSEPQSDDSQVADSNITLKYEASAVERRIPPTLSDSLVKEAVLSAVPSVLRRLGHPSEGSISSRSGEESIVYSYIPCRDQREKEDEELWVANEAADPTGAQAYDSAHPRLLPPPGGWEGGPGSLDRTETGKTQRPNSGTAVWSEQLSGVDVSEVPLVGSNMCTVAPTIAGDPRVGVPAPPRKHYSTRQRTAAETQIIKFKAVGEEAKCKDKWSEGDKANLPTSSMTCKPTKRFSFLVRSNSVKQEEAGQIKGDEAVTCQGTCPPANHEAPAKQTTAPQSGGLKDAVTPSDRAILDKLASLNLDTPAEVKLRSKPRVSLYDPPCTRCGEPVYPQERTEPTLRLVFHSSCFKCHHCGVRLALKTFFRSPLDSRDTRLFCRSHVPTLDPGKLEAARSDSSASSGKSSPDCTERDISRGRSSSPSTCIQERLEIVKCDTIGLRYF